MGFFELTDEWTLQHDGGELPAGFAAVGERRIPATAPGVVHTDLLTAGLIPDPYVDDNEALLAWIGHSDWRYETTFDWQPDGEDVHELVAEGLDTVARVELNGVEIARTVNQHRTYRWRVDHLLRPGANELRVRFASPIAYAREREAVLGARPHSYDHPFNAIRKSACNFGWDWGPALVTCGIWRRIGISSWSGCRLAAVRPQTGLGGDPRHLRIEVEVQRDADAADAADLTVRAEVAGTVLEAHLEPTATRAVLEGTIADADLWWPRGYGDAALTPLVVSAGDDRWEQRIGFRCVEIDTTADDDGSPFVVRINGAEVYIRGANWIPDDTFFPRITRERLAERFADATDAGMNLLRVWGGGIYESDDFYDLADENGLLVWQDFLLACAAYSEDAELWDEFAAEARDNVTRLASHPSLIVWNGGNENIWGWVDWKWRPRLNGATWGDGYYQQLFPAIVAELAPATPYSPGSPYGFSTYVHPNDPAHGTTHIWDVWNQVDYDVYRSYRPRFVSEFGFQGPPAWSTLFSVVHDEPADPYGPLMLVHQKAVDGNGKLERGLGAHISAPRTIDDWHWATQLNQARAVAFGIAHFRSLHPLNQGVIVWQLNDCWPVISWAAVDSLGIRKPLWHALREVYADRFASFQPRGDDLVLALQDDHATPWRGTAVLRRLSLEGAELARAEVAVDIAPRASTSIVVPRALAVAHDPSREVLVADLPDGVRALWFFAEDPKLALEAEPVSVTSTVVGDVYEVQVVARSLVKDLTLLVDRVNPEARVDRALVTLLPGESTVFRVTAPAGLDADAFGRAPALRSANDLVPTAALIAQ